MIISATFFEKMSKFINTNTNSNITSSTNNISSKNNKTFGQNYESINKVDKNFNSNSDAGSWKEQTRAHKKSSNSIINQIDNSSRSDTCKGNHYQQNGSFKQNDLYQKNTKKNNVRTKKATIPDDGISLNDWVRQLSNTESIDKVNELSDYAKSKLDNGYWANVDLVKEMIRNHKYIVLDGVLGKIDKSQSNQKKYKPHNENVWVGKQHPESVTADLIIDTFKVLIKYFDFSDLSENSIDGNSKIDVYDMLKFPKVFYLSVIKRDKRLPMEVQNELYIYYTRELHLKTPDAFASAESTNPDIMKHTRDIIKGYFNSDKPIKKRLETAESFLGALMNKNNKILPEVRDRCYDYFTREFIDSQHFVICMREIINKITITNHILFRDIMLFMMSRDISTITIEFFNSIVTREFTGINEQIAVETMLLEPTTKIDFSKYFSTIDIKSFQKEFIQLILTNYNSWVSGIVQQQKSKNPDVSENEFISNDIAVVMMIFGIAFANKYFENQILDEMIYIIKNKIDIIKGFGVFLETSKINLTNLNMQEHELIQHFIQIHYVNNTLKNKMTIESMIGKILSNESMKFDIRQHNIQLFLDTGSFLPVKKHSPKESIKSGSKLSTLKLKSMVNFKKSSGRFDCFEEDSEEEDSEEEDSKEENSQEEKSVKQDENFDADEDFVVDEELPEPNPKAIRTLNNFKKCNEYGLLDAIDEVIYSIESNKLSADDFAHGMIYCLGESKISDIPKIKTMIQNVSTTVPGYTNLMECIDKVLKTYPQLIDIFICDNPKFNDILRDLFD